MSIELDEQRKTLQELESEVDWLGKTGKGTKVGGKGNRGGKGWPPSTGVRSTTATGATGARDMSTVVCAWCRKAGHFRRDCAELKKFKEEKDAERARKGDHSVYVPPQRPQQTTRAGSRISRR